MGKFNFLLFAGILVMGFSAFTQAEDIPVKAEDVSLFSDIKAWKVGDVITVIISESNSATKSAKTSTKKQDKASTSGAASAGALKGLFPGMSGDATLSNQFDGQGSTVRSGSLTSRMTVKVIEVLPNRNLLVEGSKTMEINEDVEVVVLSGIVRTEDIGRSNTINSYQIADAKFTYKGKGSVSQGHRPGIFTRILNWIL